MMRIRKLDRDDLHVYGMAAYLLILATWLALSPTSAPVLLVGQAVLAVIAWRFAALLAADIERLDIEIAEMQRENRRLEQEAERRKRQQTR